MQNDKDNLNTILDATFKFAKKTAKEFYFKQWAKNPPACPAFDGEVINISHIGWAHITHEEYRTKMDILGRLFILERAKQLLEEMPRFQSHEKRDDIDYWVFEGVIATVSIRVIVRSVNQGERHFYSIVRKGTVSDEINSDIFLYKQK